MDQESNLGRTLRIAAEARYNEQENEYERLETKRRIFTDLQIKPRIVQLSGALLMTSPVVWQWRVTHYVSTFYMSWTKRDHVGGQLNLHIEGLTEWRQLLPLFAVLGTQGYHEEAWTSRDDAASYTRIYSYKVVKEKEEYLEGEDQEELTLQLHATLPGDTDDCQRILVGYREDRYPEERERSTPKYEFRCRSDESPSLEIPQVPDEDIRF